MINKNYIISYTIYIIFIALTAYIAKFFKEAIDQKNSYYSRLLQKIEAVEAAVAKKMTQEEYNQYKQQAKEIIYKVEQLGKEFAWDAATKHSKATEWIAQATGLSEEDIFDIIKITVGMMNAHKDSI